MCCRINALHGENNNKNQLRYDKKILLFFQKPLDVVRYPPF